MIVYPYYTYTQPAPGGPADIKLATKRGDDHRRNQLTISLFHEQFFSFSFVRFSLLFWFSFFGNRFLNRRSPSAIHRTKRKFGSAQQTKIGRRAPFLTMYKYRFDSPLQNLCAFLVKCAPYFETDKITLANAFDVMPERNYIVLLRLSEPLWTVFFFVVVVAKNATVPSRWLLGCRVRSMKN